MHDRLLELVADALACHGQTPTRNAVLEGRSGTVYTVPLLAEGPAGAIIIDLQSDDPLPRAAVGDMADVLHDVGADAALLCHLGAVESGAAADGVSLWGFDHLVHFIGEALVCQATGATPQPLSLAAVPPPMPEPAQSLDEVLPAAFQDEASGALFQDETRVPALHDRAPDAALQDEPMSFDLDALEQLPGGDGLLGFFDARPEGSAQYAAEDVPAFRQAGDGPEHASLRMPESRLPQGDRMRPMEIDDAPVDPAPRYAHPLLPIRVTPDEARVRARGVLTADHVQMVLQPVHLIDYECDLLAEGSLRYDTVSGRVQVHGTDKTVSEVDAMAVDVQGFTRLPDVPRLPSHERTLRVSDQRAGERANAHLLDAHKRIVEVEVDDPDRGFSYTEKKKVEPRPDHIRLNPLGVFHRVLWRLVGTAGHIDVDALTGDIVEEVLHRPRHDTLVID